MKNKTYLLALLLLTALPALAQKTKQDSTKMLSRLWIIDAKSMLAQIKNPDERISVQKTLKKTDIFLDFKADGTVKTNQGGNVDKDRWAFSPDGKKIIIDDKDEMTIKELSVKRLAFFTNDRPNVIFYLTAPKKGYKLRIPPSQNVKKMEEAKPKE